MRFYVFILISDVTSNTICTEPAVESEQIQDIPLTSSVDKNETQCGASEETLNTSEPQPNIEPDVSVTISDVPTDPQEICNMESPKETDKSQEPQESIIKDEEVSL